MIEEKLFRKVFGKNLRQTRYEEISGRKKATIEEIANNSNLNNGHLGQIERGEKLPNVYTLYKLFVGKGISVDQLFTNIKRQTDTGRDRKARKPPK